MDPVIQKNVERWKGEQARKAERKAQREALALKQLTAELGCKPNSQQLRQRVDFILKERRAKWMLKECRATIGEIVKAHQR